MTANNKKKAHPKHHTQWAAQFAVASELCKRGYEVAFTMGNHPLKDLMVISPNGIPFAIDEKGLYKKNTWPVGKRPPNANLFYVFALVPENAPNKFFILTQDETNTGIDTEVSHTRGRTEARGELLSEAGYFYGIEWNFVLPYENAWATLPK